MNVLGENTKKYKPFSVQVEKEIKKVDQDGNEDITAFLTKYDSLKVHDLWQVHYQIFSTVLQKEFIKLNAKIVIVFLNMNMRITI